MVPDSRTVKLRFTGRTRSGGEVNGVTTENAATFVERQFRNRWQSLSVSEGADEVGGITRNPDTGRRTWWADPRPLTDVSAPLTAGV